MGRQVVDADQNDDGSRMQRKHILFEAKQQSTTDIAADTQIGYASALQIKRRVGPALGQ